MRKAAQRRRLSTGEWVRQAIEVALREGHHTDPLDKLACLEAPTGDMAQVLAEIEAGRG